MDFRADSSELDFYDDTPRGRLAKLPFGILLIILTTGCMSYFLESRPTSNISAQEKVIEVIAQRQSPGKFARASTTSRGRAWTLLGSALLVQGLAGVFAVKVFRRPKPQLNGRPHYEARK